MDNLNKVYLLLIVCHYPLNKLANAQSTLGREDNQCNLKLGENNQRLRHLEEDLQEVKRILQNTLVNKHFRYQIFYDQKTWDNADASCRSLGANLVALETQAEKDQVVGMIQCPCPGLDGFWTSGIERGNNNWIWNRMGGSLDPELWGSNEPSGDGDCVDLLKTSGVYFVNDAPCSTTMCYICEI